jgi:hypothetical protein
MVAISSNEFVAIGEIAPGLAPEFPEAEEIQSTENPELE